MKREKEFVKDFSKNLIHRIVENDSAGWPPNCTAFAYQPVRPCKKRTGAAKEDMWWRTSQKLGEPKACSMKR